MRNSIASTASTAACPRLIDQRLRDSAMATDGDQVSADGSTATCCVLRRLRTAGNMMRIAASAVARQQDAQRWRLRINRVARTSSNVSQLTSTTVPLTSNATQGPRLEVPGRSRP